MRRGQALRAGVLATVLGSASGCTQRDVGVGTYATAPVILISIDTLRADHLPAYGYKAVTTPALDRLASEGIVFENAYSHCPLTLPAHASMLTGLLPPHHGVRDNIGFSLKPEQRTLATRFKQAGFRTGGAVSAFVLRSQTGIAQGFEAFDDALELEAGQEALGQLQRDGEITLKALTRWVEAQAGARFFAFLHLYEPHSPYTPPERYRRFALPYDGEIAYADELVGRFLDALKARGLYDRALVIVSSDHGEGLEDHGEQEHGIFLYREAVHVPLLVRLPGAARAGTRVAATVAQVDIAPTLLDLAGVPGDGMDGVSLRDALASGSATPRRVYSETFYPRYHFGWSELIALTEERFRYIRAPRPELYDLAGDPGERQNVIAAKRSAADAMNGWLEKAVAGSKVAAPEDIPPDVREKLQALGYIGSGRAVADAKNLPDPKDRIGEYEELRRALTLRRAGKDAEAVVQFRAVLKKNPVMLDAWEMLGLTLVRMERSAEGIEALGKAIELDPTRAEPHLALAKLYTLDRKPQLAAQHAELAARLDPGKAYEVLAQLMLDQNRSAEAAGYARKSLAADARRVMSHFVLGVLAQRAGRYEEALAAFRKADAANRLQKGSVVLSLHASMGDCLARLGREAEAEREFLEEIQAVPWGREGRVGLAMLYRSQRRDAEARTVLAGLVDAQPRPSADAYWTVVRTLTLLGDAPAAREWAARARVQFPADPRFR